MIQRLMHKTKAKAPLWVSLGLAVVLAACSSNAATPGPTSAPPTPLPAEATASGGSPTEAAGATEPAAATGGQMVWVLAEGGNEARYQVTEQLADRDLPSDAIGVTSAISGQIVINEDGSVVADASKFTVDLTTLKSDRSRRDQYIQRNTLETSNFPMAEFVPTQVVGLPSPLPTSGEVTFQLVGDMTVHGTTHPATWNVTAQVDGDTLTGTAASAFTFGDFGLRIPKVFSVLSVEDNIRLEYNFNLVRQAS